MTNLSCLFRYALRILFLKIQVFCIAATRMPHLIYYFYSFVKQSFISICLKLHKINLSKILVWTNYICIFASASKATNKYIQNNSNEPLPYCVFSWLACLGDCYWCGGGFLRISNFNYMATTNKDSRRQQLINLKIGEKLLFPPSARTAVKSQLSELKFSTGQRYSVTSSQEKVIVTRIS